MKASGSHLTLYYTPYAVDALGLDGRVQMARSVFDDAQHTEALGVFITDADYKSMNWPRQAQPLSLEGKGLRGDVSGGGPRYPIFLMHGVCTNGIG